MAALRGSPKLCTSRLREHQLQALISKAPTFASLSAAPLSDCSLAKSSRCARIRAWALARSDGSGSEGLVTIRFNDIRWQKSPSDRGPELISHRLASRLGTPSFRGMRQSISGEKVGQAQCPFRAAFGRLRASQGDEPGLLLAIEDAWNGRRRALLAVQHRVHAALHKLLSNTGAHDRIRAQGFRNFWIVPLRPQWAFIGPEEIRALSCFWPGSCLSGSALRAVSVHPRSVRQHSASC